jgi:Zn-dependent M28 family amino/carboxypeptidase
MLPCAFWHFGAVVPGAGDDLSGIAVMHAFGGIAASARLAGGSGGLAGDSLKALLQRSEVVLLATSGEEAGLRGAKRFVERHAAALAAVPTAAVVLESTHEAEFLSCVSRLSLTACAC